MYTTAVPLHISHQAIVVMRDVLFDFRIVDIQNLLDTLYRTVPSEALDPAFEVKPFASKAP